MNELLKLYIKCKKTGTNFFIAVFFYIFYKIKGKEILLHHKAKIIGARNIETNGLLQIGTSEIGFSDRNDVTLLNVRGKLIFNGTYTIGRGCRFDIGENATVNIGSGGFINPFTKVIIQHGLHIGSHCLISWDCQFLDSDFHNIVYNDKRMNLSNEITIEDNVWIGCGVSVYKGTQIAKGSVVAANSIVRGIFTEQNVLIGGNPAKIIKRNINWH